MRFLLIGTILLTTTIALRAAPDAADVEFFEKKIRPVLVEQCFSCHSADAVKNKKLRGGLRLDTRQDVLKGGDTGPAVVPGKPEQGTLLKALRYEGDVQMPPKSKLPASVVADFETWIRKGAVDPREAVVSGTRTIDIAAGRSFWAFQPPRAQTPPDVVNRDRVRNDIDRFLFAKMEEKRLQPVPEADRATLIRRIHFDLVGLPPTPEEMDRALSDPSPEWYEKLVDALLASPRHGERWARHWLDVARYAEDQAHTFAVTPRTNAWRYRDWVIKAFNDDMPYDRFARLQIAGDLVPESEGDSFTRLAATGFLGLGAEYYKNTAKEQALAEEMDDRIDTLTRGFLALTVSCARCHDHKFDPIPTRDYYSLAGIYNGTNMQPVFIATKSDIDRFNTMDQARKAKEKQVQTLLADVAKKHNRKTLSKDDENKLLSDEQKKQLTAMRTEIETLKKTAPARPAEVHSLTGPGKAMKVFIRGNPLQQGEPAPKGWLQVLSSPNAKTPADFTRLDLAEAVASPNNPLTARVIVNRVWQWHFGKGIVGTAGNFGTLGDRPTHPELLDWLAVRFMEDGWSLKSLHRRIVLSSVYRSASADRSENMTADPANTYLWRAPRRRLEVEAWRDALLAVSGRLDIAMGGPTFNLRDAGNARRTVYARISRHELDGLLRLFDFPDANVTSAKRTTTTVPQQQLFVMNSDFMVNQSKAFAARLQKAASSDAERIRIAYNLAYGRPPREIEVKLGLAYLEAPHDAARDKLTRWEQYAQALLAANEFLYVD